MYSSILATTALGKLVIAPYVAKKVLNTFFTFVLVYTFHQAPFDHTTDTHLPTHRKNDLEGCYPSLFGRFLSPEHDFGNYCRYDVKSRRW